MALSSALPLRRGEAAEGIAELRTLVCERSALILVQPSSFHLFTSAFPVPVCPMHGFVFSSSGIQI